MTGNGGQPPEVNIDQMIAWVRGKNYDDAALGYAVRRIAQLGTVEQLVAFTVTARQAVRAIDAVKAGPSS